MTDRFSTFQGDVVGVSQSCALRIPTTLPLKGKELKVRQLANNIQLQNEVFEGEKLLKHCLYLMTLYESG